MSTTTKTPAERVMRYRDGYGDIPYSHDRGREAYTAAMGALIPNILDSIEQDAAVEATAWATLASVISHRYRKEI